MLHILQTALELGFLYALVAMALFLSYRVLDIADLTTDGCFVLGCAVSVTLTAAGHPFLAIPAAMLAGAWGILSLNWTAMLLMLFCMGASSTLFSPALNGSIPEIFPPHSVPRVNALFKLFTTASILLGVMLAGAALDRQWVDTLIPFGRWLVAVGVVLVAVLGLAGAALVPYRPAVPCRERPPFPWLGTWDSLNDFLRLRRDRALALVIAADAFFYFISTLVLLEINALGVRELGFSKTVTSLLPTALMLGICAGSS